MGTAVRKCQVCGAKCCRYVAVEIDKPTTAEDFDDIRWYVAHENVTVFIEDGDWFICFDSKCQYLTPENTCSAYEHRPKICADHSVEDCEESDGEPDRVDLCTPADVEEYMARKLRRKKKR